MSGYLFTAFWRLGRIPVSCRWWLSRCDDPARG